MLIQKLDQDDVVATVGIVPESLEESDEEAEGGEGGESQEKTVAEI